MRCFMRHSYDRLCVELQSVHTHNYILNYLVELDWSRKVPQLRHLLELQKVFTQERFIPERFILKDLHILALYVCEFSGKTAKHREIYPQNTFQIQQGGKI